MYSNNKDIAFLLMKRNVYKISLPKCTGHSKYPLSTTQEKTLQHGHHQMVNTEIRLIVFSAAKNAEALYSQQKQDQELTVAQIINSLLANSY